MGPVSASRAAERASQLAPAQPAAMVVGLGQLGLLLGLHNRQWTELPQPKRTGI